MIQRPLSVRAYAIGIVLILILPLSIVMSSLLVRSASLEKAEVASRLRQVAAAIADNLDREIDRRIAILETLATSTHLRERRWQDFYDQSTAALKGRSYIILVDSEGRQIINTYVPYGIAPALTGDPATIDAIVKSKAPVVSNLFHSLVVKRYVVNVSIPIIEDGVVRYVLSIALFPEDIREILRGQNLPATWISAVWDRNDLLIARSLDRDAAVGMKFPRQLDDATRKSVAVREAVNLSGQTVLVAATLSRYSGWRVSVNVPSSIAEEGQWRTFRWFGFVAFLSFALGLALSLSFAQRLQAALDQVTAAAVALRQRSNPPRTSAATAVVEANDVIEAMDQAAVAIANHEEHQRLLLGEVTHRTKNLLTVIQAMAARTFADVAEEPKRAFMDRLHAVARAQDLLIQSDWKGMGIKTLIESELFSHLEQVALVGPPLTIKPPFVQTLFLLIHELCTNAVKYGALSNSAGHVHIRWEVIENQPTPIFHFVWKERGGPQVSAPSHRGFGTTLLNLPSTMADSASVEISYPPEGLVYVMKLPTDEVLINTT